MRGAGSGAGQNTQEQQSCFKKYISLNQRSKEINKDGNYNKLNYY